MRRKHSEGSIIQVNLDKADLSYFVAKLARAKLGYGTKESEIGPDGQWIYLVDLVVFGEDTEIITVRIAGRAQGHHQERRGERQRLRSECLEEQ